MVRELLLKIYHKWKSIPEDRVFLVLLVMFGCICLTVTGSWHIYTDPLKDGGEKFIAKLGIELPQSWAEDEKESKEDLRADAGDEIQDREEPSDENNGEGEETPDGEVIEEEQSSEEDTEEEPSEEYTEEEDSEEPEPEPPELVIRRVEDDYFNDAVFIGDSRTVGMYEYSSLKETSTFYASVGLSVHKLFTAKIVEVPGQHGKITVDQALSENQFSKVYFMMGINEMGTGTVESFLAKYQECVNRIRELQPDAIIYLQGIMQVTEKRSAKGDVITNEGIAVRNEGIKAMADGETIFYLEINEALCDENGALCAEYSGDGVHLKAQYIDLWKEYLKNNAMVWE